MFLQYSVSVVNVDAARKAVRAVEAEMAASNRRSVGLGVGAGRGRAGAAGIGRVANENASARAAETLFRNQERQGIREHDRAERIKTVATEREARRRAQAELAVNRQRSAALYRIYHAEEREKRRLGALTEHARARTAADITRATKSVLGGTAGRVASIGRGAIAMTGLAGGALFAGAIHGAMARGASAAELASQLSGNDATPESLKATKEKVLAAATATRGYDAPEVIAGMSAFQATAGEPEATMKIAPRLTEMGLATGAEIEQLGQMYSAVYASIRNGTGGAAKSVDQLLEETDRIARVFAAMGQKGAIELKDIASIGPELAAVAGRYGGDQVTNIKNIGALAQIARQTGGAPSAAEASTAVQSFATDLIQNGKDIRAMGVDVYSDKSKTALKALPELVPELMAATGGNLEKLQDVANIRGIKSLTGFSAQYNEAYKAARSAGKTETEAKEAGKTVVRKRFEEFGGLEMKAGEVKTKADARMLEADKQLETQMRNLSQAVGAELLPTVIRMIPSIAQLVEPATRAAKVLADFVNWFAENPLAGVGAIIGAAFTVEIAKAGIGMALNAALSAAVKAMVGGGAVETVAAGVAGTGAAGTVAGGAAAGGATRLMSVLTGSGMNITPAVTAGGATLGAGAALAGAGIMAGLGAMKVGQVHEQGRVEERGAEIVRNLEAKVANTGVWETAVAEEQAQGEFRNVYRTTGSGIGGGADLQAIKAQIADVAAAKMAGGTVDQKQSAELTAVMRDLTNAIAGFQPAAPGVKVNTSNTPTVPVK